MPAPIYSEALEGQIVVVSPHLDDGVLSLGSSITSWARQGSRVELLTVFGCDPRSGAPAGGWDCRAGFRTEGESARARRKEDQRACAILGVMPVWLTFGSVDYDRRGDEADVREAVAAAAVGADAILLPGSPLSHPDHVWLTRTLLDGPLPWRRLGLYVEQPYTQRADSDARTPRLVEEVLETGLSFVPVSVGLRDRLAKWRAIRQYRSQLPLLGMRRSLRRGPLVLARGDEAIAWASGRTGLTPG